MIQSIMYFCIFIKNWFQIFWRDYRTSIKYIFTILSIPCVYFILIACGLLGAAMMNTNIHDGCRPGEIPDSDAWNKLHSYSLPYKSNTCVGSGWGRCYASNNSQFWIACLLHGGVYVILTVIGYFVLFIFVCNIMVLGTCCKDITQKAERKTLMETGHEEMIYQSIDCDQVVDINI